MGFTYSAGVITQTGTDTSLAGLVGLTGVTTSTLFGAITVYNIGNSQLVIDGTLSFDAESELLETGTSVPAWPTINVNGTFNVGVETSISYNTNHNPAGSFTRIARRAGIACLTLSPTTYLASQASLQVNSGGTVRLYGTALLHKGTMNIKSGATFESYDGMIFAFGVSRHRWFYDGIGGTRLYVSGNASPVNITGAGKTYAGITPDVISILFSSSDITVRNYQSGNATTMDHRVNQGAVVTSYNPVYGSKLRFGVAENAAASNANYTGGLLARREINFNIKNTSDADIQDVKVWIPYTDDGNRVDGLGYTISTLSEVTGTTDVNGDLALDVILASWIRTVGGVSGAANAGLNAPSYLNKNGDDTDDTFDILFVQYNYLITKSADQSLRGSEVLGRNEKLIIDSLVTQLTKATVDAYTTIDDALESYDIAKSYLCDNYAGEDVTIITRAGLQLDLGSYNLVINATAGSAFAFDGSTITIKSSLFTSDITTTGTITLSNGAIVIGSFTDSGGTTTRTQLSLTGLRANSEVRVYQAGTATEVDGIENSGTTFSTTTTQSSVDLVIFNTQYQPIRTLGVDTTVNVNLPIQQIFDRNYTNP